MKKLKTFNSICFRGKSHFEDDGTQNYFIFQPIYRYLKTDSANNDTVLSWRSKGLFDQSIKAPSTSNKLLNPSLDYLGIKIRVKFNRDSLKQKRLDFSHGKIVNIGIVYELDKSVNISSYSTLENCCSVQSN